MKRFSKSTFFILLTFIITVAISFLTGYFEIIGIFKHDYLIYKDQYNQLSIPFKEEPLIYFLYRPFFWAGFPYSVYFYIQGFALFWIKFVKHTVATSKWYILSLIIYSLLYLNTFELLRQRASLSITLYILACVLVQSSLPKLKRNVYTVVLLVLSFFAHSTVLVFLIPVLFNIFLLYVPPRYYAGIFSVSTILRCILFVVLLLSSFQVVFGLDLLGSAITLYQDSKYISYVYSWDNYTGVVSILTLIPFVLALSFFSAKLSRHNLFFLSSYVLISASLLCIKYNLVAIQFFSYGAVLYLFFLIREYSGSLNHLFFAPFYLLFATRLAFLLV